MLCVIPCVRACRPSLRDTTILQHGIRELYELSRPGHLILLLLSLPRREVLFEEDALLDIDSGH